MELEKDFYNKVFTNSKRYNCSYQESPDYRIGMWPIVMEFIKNGSRILELGCGTGQLAEMIKDNKEVEYLGVDFSEVAIKKARERVPEYEFKCYDLREDLSFIETYNPDLVLAFEFFEHIENDLRVINAVSCDILFSVPSFPAKQHTRCFNTIDEVLQRYNAKHIKTFGSTHRIYLCSL